MNTSRAPGPALAPSFPSRSLPARLLALVALGPGACGESEVTGANPGAARAEPRPHTDSTAAVAPEEPRDPARAAEERERGRRLFHAGRYGEAQAAFQAATEADPADSDAFYWWGRSLVVISPSQSPSRAIQAFERSAELDPSRVDVYWGMGLASFFIADHSRAKRELKRLFERGADGLPPQQQAEAHHFYGAILVNEGRAGEALPHLARALELHPAMADSAYQIGLAHLSLDQPDQALASFERAAALQPGHLSTHHQLGKLYARLGEPEKAERARAIHRLLNELTDNLSARAAADVERRLRILAELTAIQPENHSARYEHAELLWRSRQAPEAGLLLDALIREETGIAAAYFLRAQIALHHQDASDARRVLAAMARRLPGWTADDVPEPLRPYLPE